MSSEKGLVPSSFRDKDVTKTSNETSVQKDYNKLKKLTTQKHRIIFAFDATGSRSEFWEIAIQIQEQMLQEVMKFGELEVKIVAYRDRYSGPDDYLIHSFWSSDTEYLVNYMHRVTCHGGGGNHGESIDAPLEYILKENKNHKISAVILVGDEPVVPQDRGRAYELADEIGKEQIPIYTFLEGFREQARIDLREIAKRTKGIFDQFSNTSPKDIADRLKVILIYTIGGKEKLKEYLTENKQLSSGATELVKKLLPGGN